MRRFIGFLGIFCFLFVSSCSSSGTKVTRVNSGTQIDLSGYWNDVDVKIVCESLMNDCLNSPRVVQAIAAKGKTLPVVLVGSFRNESSEHIDTGIISSTMEMAIFDSGKMNFVAGGDTRNEIREERQGQQIHASEATASALANETGADFLLTGTVRAIVDKANNQTVRTYFVFAEMTNIETNMRIWIGKNSEIKKVIVQQKYKL